MKSIIYALFALAFVSTLSAQCVDLSTGGPWGTQVVNDSGVLYVNENTILCTGTYYLNAVGGTAALQMNASGIYLDCNHSVLDGVNRDGYGIYLAAKENETIENCTIGNYQYGIYLNGAKYNNLSFNTAYNNSFHGFYLFSGSSGNILTNNTGYDSTSSDGSGFSFIVGSNNNILTNNTAYNDVEGFNLISSSNNTFTNNLAYTHVEGFYFYDSSNNTITNNTAYNSTIGFSFQTGSNFNAIINNTAYNSTSGFFFNDHSNSNNVTANLARNNSDTGIYLFSSSNNILAGNTVYGNINDGFYFYISYNNTLTNATAYDNTYGFHLYSSPNNTLVNNTAYGNILYGLYLYDSSNNTLINSTAYGNSNYGVYLTSTSTRNNFTNTFIYNQSYYIYQGASASPTNNFTELALGYNSSVGLLNFTFLNISRLDLSEGNTIFLRPDWVSVKSSDAGAAQANASAYITINNSNCASLGIVRATGFPTSMVDILANGLHYSTTKTCNGDLAIFNVSGFSGYTLGKEVTTLTLNFDPSSAVTYKTETNVSCAASNGVVVMGLYLNGTLVAGPSTSYLEYLTNHSGGYYNYTCNTTGDENYSSGLHEGELYVQRAETGITFNVSPSTPTTVGNETNLSCTANNTQVTVEIFVNDASKGSAVQHFEYLANLSVGTYNFTCNTTGNENYTSASGSTNDYEVEQRNTTLDLTIPYPRPMVGEETNVSCSANTGEVNISLYRNGVRVANGTVQIDDVGVLPPAVYTYVCNTTGSDNYTSYFVSGVLQFQSSSTSGGTESQCHLEADVPDGVAVGEDVPLRVLRYTDDDHTRTSLYGATVLIMRGGATSTYSTDTGGYVHYTPATAGTYSYAASFGDCSGADGTFTATEPEAEGPVVAPQEEPPVQPPAQEGQPSGQVQPTEGQGGDGTSGAAAIRCSSDADCGQGRVCRDGGCVQVTPVEGSVVESAAVESGAQEGLLGNIIGAVQKSFVLIVLLLALLLPVWFFFWKKKGKPRTGNEELIGEEERGGRRK